MNQQQFIYAWNKLVKSSRITGEEAREQFGHLARLEKEFK